MEAAVELVSLYNHIVALIAQDIVCAIILGNSTKEGIAVHGALMHYMGAHRGSCGLPVCSCHTESFMCTGQHSQHLCPFLHIKVILTEEDKFLMVLRDGRGVNNESGVLILACMGNLVYIFFIMNQHPFFFQLAVRADGVLS